jgi:hypothetical protein
MIEVILGRIAHAYLLPIFPDTIPSLQSSCCSEYRPSSSLILLRET